MTLSRRTVVLGGAVLGGLGLGVSACGATNQGTVAGSVAAGPASGTPLAPAPTDLRRARVDAGIPDPPVADAAIAAVAGGLPDVTLEALGGGSPTRLAGVRGRPMVINFWAQWCAPCREEAPRLRELLARGKDQVLLVGVDTADPRADLAIEFATLVRWFYPHLADPEKQLHGALGLPGLPSTVFVRADGVVAHRHPGLIRTDEELFGLVKDHLGVVL